MAVNYLLKNVTYGKNDGYRKFIFTVLYFQSILLQHGLSVWSKYSYSEIKSELFFEMEWLIQNWPLKKNCNFRGQTPPPRKKTHKPTYQQQQIALKADIFP